MGRFKEQREFTLTEWIITTTVIGISSWGAYYDFAFPLLGSLM